MEAALESLQNKYSRGKISLDNSVDKPTGQAYKEKKAEDIARAKFEQNRIENQTNDVRPVGNDKLENEEGDDEDYELRLLRDKRLQEIKRLQGERLENISKGHGQYREIVQDEFLNEVTNSTRVICHFYHREFPRCEIMDFHLNKLATKHIETKFIKINSEKAPFFVSKLAVRTIPTLIFFVDGVAKGKILGFEGLSDNMPEEKADEWPTIDLARLLGDNDMIDKSAITDDDDVERRRAEAMEKMRKQGYLGLKLQDLNLEEDEDDFEDL